MERSPRSIMDARAPRAGALAIATCITIGLALAGTAGAQTAQSEAAPAPEAESPKSVLEALRESVTGGDISVDLRLRIEIADQSGLDTSQAYTERLRLGYGTRPFHGFSGFVEFEDTRSAAEGLYNAAGLNGEPEKTVIADPENTELNQVYARYENEYVTAIAGRQRIILDDHRFVGNVGWRQNEQTYDAYTLIVSWIPRTKVFYSFVDDVNRIFGPDAHRDFTSDSHLLNVSFDARPIGKITGFAYFLDFTNSDPNSSNTVGVRVEGKQDLPEEFDVGYVASYAYQVDAGDNPNNYGANYYFFEGTFGRKKVGALGVGYEVLGSDNGNFAFRTPLATLHKFNGWADVFLTTPNRGLQDLYFFVGPALPLGIKSRLIYHLFFADEGGSDFGGEFDAVLSKALTREISVLGKLAVYHPEGGFSNIQRYWVQTEIKF